MYVGEEYGHKWILDPHDNYTDKKPMDIREVGGIIPAFFADVKDEDDVIPAAERNYGFPLSFMEGHTLNDQGDLECPRDPTLSPIMLGNICGVIVRLYNYGIVAFEYKDGTLKVTRMD